MAGRRRSHPTRFQQPQAGFMPIAAINTTPLIDMMLVILIMLIISIPISSHKVPLDLPSGPPPERPAVPPVHTLVIDASGALAWDGAPLAAAALAPRLAGFEADLRRPVLHLAPAAEARYERVDQVLAVIRRTGATRLGFIGNERFADTLDR